MSEKTPKRLSGDTPAAGTPAGASARRYRGKWVRSAEDKKKQARQRMRKMREKRAKQLEGDNEMSSDEDTGRQRTDRRLLDSFMFANNNTITDAETGKIYWQRFNTFS